MNTAKHTPGPWVAYNSIGGKILHRWRIRGNDMESIAVINDRWDGDAQVANAHLIAAAPAMYEALQAIAQLGRQPETKGDSRPFATRAEELAALAEQALAQAEGRTPCVQ